MAKKESLVDQARPHLDADERIDAVVVGAYETRQLGGKVTQSGIMLATDRRVVFFGKKLGGYNLESFPYQNISSFEQSKGMMGHTIRFAAAGNTVSMKWIQQGDLDGFTAIMRERVGQPSAVSQTQPAAPVSVADELVKLAGLRDAGVLSAAEFEQQKARLLG